MKKQILFSIPFGLMALMSCSQPTTADAEVALCNDLVALEASLQQLASLDGNSTVSDLNDAQKQVDNDMKSVRESAEQVEESRLNDLEAAYSEFDKTVKSVSGDETLGEASATVQSATETLLSTRNEIYSGLSCQ